MPAASLTAVVMVAVYVVEEAKLPVGVKVAVVPELVTTPVTPPLKVNVAAVTVVVVMGSLNVAVIAEFTATSIAALAGLVLDTVGGVVSGGAPPPPPHAGRIVKAARIRPTRTSVRPPDFSIIFLR